MLERMNQPGYESISKPSAEAMEVLRRVRAEHDSPTIAEVGVGIGASTIEFVKLLSGAGAIHLFDFEDVVDALVADLRALEMSAGVHLVPHGNGRQRFNGYAWSLATMLSSLEAAGLQSQIFDFVYLDGAHSFHHDAPACLVLKRMVRPGGYLVFDDMYWSFNRSPVLNPQKKPQIREDYSEDQLARPHVELVVELFVRSDPEFEQVFLDDRPKPYRPVFRRVRR